MSPNRFFLSICALLFCVSCLPNTFLRLVCFRCSFLFFTLFCLVFTVTLLINLPKRPIGVTV